MCAPRWLKGRAFAYKLQCCLMSSPVLPVLVLSLVLSTSLKALQPAPTAASPDLSPCKSHSFVPCGQHGPVLGSSSKLAMLHCRLKNRARWVVPELIAAPSGQSSNVQLMLQVVPCLALHDTMRHVKSDVASVGFGGCMGMAGFLLAVGKKVSVG